MAADLLETPVAQRMLAVASSCGLDLVSALQGDADALRPTDVAQPGLLLVECACAAALPRDIDVAAVAGHSVGEYAACVAAGALEPEAAMSLVVARGRQMAAMQEGTMAAVLGADADVLQRVCADVQRDGETVVVANVNAPGQVVISGTRAGVDAASRAVQDAGARRVVPLNVSGAFHSPLMEDAAARFAQALDAAPLRDPRIPVVCNVDGDAVHDAPALRARLRAQLTSPVQWVRCVRTLTGLGADVLVEVGPGSVLTGLARRIAPDVRAVTVSSAADAAALQAPA